MAELTINEALVWMKTLQQRHAELTNLRDQNSNTRTRHYGVGGDKQETTAPTYNVRSLDVLVQNVAQEIRKLDLRLKATNAVTKVVGYDQDDAVLGSIEMA